MSKKLLIYATSVSSGGAKKRLINTINNIPSEYKVLIVKQQKIVIDNTNHIKTISLPNKFLPLFRLLYDFFLPFILYLLGYKKMYLMGNFLVGIYPGKIAWNLTNIEPFMKNSNLEYNSYSKFRLYALEALFFLSRKPNAFIFQSITTMNKMKEIIPKWEKSKLFAIYNGIELKKESTIMNKDNRCVFIGQLVRYKRLETIINQLYNLDFFSNFHLDIIGQTNWDIAYYNEIKTLITKLKITDRVIFHGALPYEKALSFIEKSKFMVYANKYDNCPNNVLESLAMNTPVLAWKNDILVELSTFGTIVLVDELLTNNELNQIISISNNKIKSNFHYNWKTHTTDILNIIERL